MGYYSFVAIARQPVTIADPLILLGEGINAFTAHTEDVDELVKLLENEGVEVREFHRLDELEAVPVAEGLLLPGEASDVLQLLPEPHTAELEE